MTTSYKNLIDGNWYGRPTEKNVNPSNINDVVGLYSEATADETKWAISAAENAFSGWSQSGILERHDILRKTSDEILARKEELGKLLSREEGKTIAEGIGEVVRASQIFDFFSAEALRLNGETIPSVRPGVSVDITREPVGVVGIITPWNFPIAIPAWKIAPALCYGNTIVFKPSEFTPGSAWELADILKRAGLPNGVLNLVMGQGPVVGQEILENPGISAVSFTGSVETGKQAAMTCAAQQKKLQLEMGGKNPLVILDDADIDLAVEVTINSAFYSTGQRCTAASRIIVTDPVHTTFVRALKARMETLVIGDALDARTDIGPVVNQIQLKKNSDYLQIGISEGATLLAGGTSPKQSTPGYYFTPSLFTDVSNGMRIAQEEIFGPIASVIRVSDYEEALSIANDTDFGLTAGICTSSLKYASHFKRNAKAGMVMINLPTAGVDFHVPFGGTKKSSYGTREQGTYAKEFYTNVKTSYTFP